MYIWFTHKASLMASTMRKAVLVLALMVMMLQIVTTPARAEQQSGEQTTPVAQQGSVTPPPANNNGSDGTPAGGGDNSTTNQSTAPSNDVGIIADPVKDESKGHVGSITDPVNDPGDAADASNEGSVLIHCSPGTGCSKEDLDAPKDEQSSSSNSKEDPDAPKDEQSSAPEAVQAGEVPGEITSTAIENDVSSQQAPTASADTQGNSASNIGEIHGCPFDYDYSDELGTCFPSDSDLGFYPVLGGDKPFPITLGGGISFVGNAPGDVLQVLGAGLEVGADSLDDTLVNFGDGGGPIGWGIQGLGYTVGFAGDTVGGLAEGAGGIIDTVADGVGDAIDDIGSALGSLF